MTGRRETSDNGSFGIGLFLFLALVFVVVAVALVTFYLSCTKEDGNMPAAGDSGSVISSIRLRFEL